MRCKNLSAVGGFGWREITALGMQAGFNWGLETRVMPVEVRKTTRPTVRGFTFVVSLLLTFQTVPIPSTK